MLVRYIIVGIGLGLLCVIAAVISHCDLTEGCTGETQFSEAFDGLMENVFGTEGAGDTVCGLRLQDSWQNHDCKLLSGFVASSLITEPPWKNSRPIRRVYVFYQ